MKLPTQPFQIRRFASMLVLCGAIDVGLAAGQIQGNEQVAAILIAEAGGEGLRGIRAVMEVIQTRAEMTGKDFVQVIGVKGAFACRNRLTMAELVKLGRAHPLWHQALAVATFGTWGNLTNGADHYHEESIRPRWAKGASVVAVIGNHRFYRLGKERGKPFPRR